MQKLVQFTKLLTVEGAMLAENIWRWWINEIFAMLPERWVGRGELIAEISGDEFIFVRESRGTRMPVTHLETHGTVSLRVCAQSVLRRTLRLPVSARFRLREILANDLERQCPLDPQAVLFTFQILSVERAVSRLVVSLVLLRRDLVEPAVTRLQRLGLRVKEVRAGGLGGGRDDRLTIAQAPKISRRHRPAILLAFLAVAVIGTDVYVRKLQQEALIAGLSSEAAQLDIAATRARAFQNEFETARKQDDFLAKQRRQPSVGVILAEITRLLPDRSWLYNLDYDGREIQIQGYSSDASSLVAMFDSSKLFDGAAFRAPMTQGPQANLQQFDLSMNLVGNSK